MRTYTRFPTASSLLVCISYTRVHISCANNEPSTYRVWPSLLDDPQIPINHHLIRRDGLLTALFFRFSGSNPCVSRRRHHHLLRQKEQS